MNNPDEPNLFALSPGCDFPTELAKGLIERFSQDGPLALAQVDLYLNTARMRTRVTEAFQAQGATFLPRIRLITEFADHPDLALPPSVPPLRIRLELVRLISALLDAEPDLAPRHALYDLSDSLASLLEEIHSEGLHPDVISSIDVSDHAEHWSRTQAFLNIVSQYFDDSSPLGAEARQRLAAAALSDRWQATPPLHPIIIAGSTGSRGTTLSLMEMVLRLPKGAVVLPGFDFDQPAAVWEQMSDALTAEDHPQYRFKRLLDRLEKDHTAVSPWRIVPPPSPGRNALMSLALRPAPVTDQWLVEGPKLSGLGESTASVTLIEAPSLRLEALSIALILREAAETGKTAALITPDRTLTRQVATALERWSIVPDDSAGRPLAMSPPGRLLRQVVKQMGQKLSADQLLALLKHPLSFSGDERNKHLLLTRDLELQLRRKGPVFPTGKDIALWAKERGAFAQAWGDAVASVIDDLDINGELPLADLVARHRSLCEKLCRGTADTGSGALWLKEAGKDALGAMQKLEAEAAIGGRFGTKDYADLFNSVIAGEVVRETVQAHPRLMIWGTLEARVQGADLVILGGLNDGVWPGAPKPDPWLNRKMRKDVGLLLPERQIGLSAHDFQQAVAAPEVVLTRALRDAEAETVPSRWVNRVKNLLKGLPDTGGEAALKAMTARGQIWIEMAKLLDSPTPSQMADPRLVHAPRPAPSPPVSARPNRLSLTEISTLIRDPYAIYARHVLGLRPLDPLKTSPDVRDRGSIMHKILEVFVRDRPAEEDRLAARARLLNIAAGVLADETPFPTARIMWLARLERAADFFLDIDRKRGGEALVLESAGSLQVNDRGFTLVGKPDRIDELPDGQLHLFDYKTGKAPKIAEQDSHAKQLRLTAVMVDRGGFSQIGPRAVASFSYVGLGAGGNEVETSLEKFDLESEWLRFETLINRYSQRNTGYTARRAEMSLRLQGDYDHLSRFGEWQLTDDATPSPVGESTS
jgi:ATP-dependent helicase/nuclease subunit B